MVIEDKKMLDRKYNKNLDIYLKEIKDFPTLTSQEEGKLIEEIKKGNPKAREKLINCNLRIVVQVAKHYATYGVDYMDLIQEGNKLLCKIVDKFHNDDKYNFKGYLRFRLHKMYLNVFFFSGFSDIKIPGYLSNFAVKKAILSGIEDGLTEQELYNEFINSMWYKTNLNYQFFLMTPGAVSLNDIYSTIDNQTTSQFLPSAEQVVMENMNLSLQDIISQFNLTEKQAEVLKLKFNTSDNKDPSFSQIGNMQNVTEQAIHFRYKEALKKIHHSPNSLELAKQLIGYGISEQTANAYCSNYQQHIAKNPNGHFLDREVLLIDLLPNIHGKKALIKAISSLSTEELEVLRKLSPTADTIKTDLSLDDAIKVYYEILPKLNNISNSQMETKKAMIKNQKSGKM